MRPYKKKSFSRIDTVFNHEIPDRVPKYEGSIEIPELNPLFDEQATGNGILFLSSNLVGILSRHPSYLRILRKVLNHPRLLHPVARLVPRFISELPRVYNYDMFAYTAGIPIVFKDRLLLDFHTEDKDKIIRGSDGRLVWRTSPDGAHTRRGFMKTLEDWDRYIEFDPDHPANTFLVKPTMKACKKLDIVPLLTVYMAAFFEELCSIFGFETLFKLLIKEKDFIKRVIREMNDYSIAVAERTIQEGGKYLYITCDLGYKGRSIISPKMFKEFFKPGITKFCRRVHNEGGKVILHSCGYVRGLLNDLVETGIDAIHPLEKAAGNNIVEIKQQFGKKLILIGNVPIPLLSHGTPKENYNYVKNLINDVSKEGGHIISSSHSITQWCKLNNFLAYYKAVEDYGKYPININ